MGMDCSSLGDLMLCEKLGITGEDVMFTSNNTLLAEYRKAFEMGAIINLDDYSQIDDLKKALEGHMPDMVALRFIPGPDHNIGDPGEAKFGLTKSQLFATYKKCKDYGVKRFEVHTMLGTNSLNILDLVESARMMFTLAVETDLLYSTTKTYKNSGRRSTFAGNVIDFAMLPAQRLLAPSARAKMSLSRT